MIFHKLSIFNHELLGTVCGYTGVIKDSYPHCGREEGDVSFERIRQITGLVGTIKADFVIIV
jgi:hypothetical protein